MKQELLTLPEHLRSRTNNQIDKGTNNDLQRLHTKVKTEQHEPTKTRG
jgi:hypothetical protein